MPIEITTNTQEKSILPDAVSEHSLDKVMVVPADVPDVAKVKFEPTHEKIATVAHQIFEKEGAPKELAEKHWEAAEADLHRATFNGV